MTSLADPKSQAGVVVQRYGALGRKFRTVGGVTYDLAVDVRCGDKMIMAYCLVHPDRGARVRLTRHAAEAGQSQPTWIVDP